MPYVPSRKTVPPAEDRAMLDVAVELVAEDIALKVDNKDNFSLRRAYENSFIEIGETLRRLAGHFYDAKYVANTPCAKLAATIYKIAEKYNYVGAYLGELNYAITRLIQRVPQIKVARGDWNEKNELRYWVYAVTVKALIVVANRLNKEEGYYCDYYCLAGVFEDVKDEYKWRVNRAYEAAQIVKSGDCYDTPFYTKLIELVDESGKHVCYIDGYFERSDKTVNCDVVPYQIVVRKTK
ncbi:MAG: hypothetical protein AAB795_02365 [Patescibacteria group bacterium]